jgi:hypothetical protein
MICIGKSIAIPDCSREGRSRKECGCQLEREREKEAWATEVERRTVFLGGEGVGGDVADEVRIDFRRRVEPCSAFSRCLHPIYAETAEIPKEVSTYSDFRSPSMVFGRPRT